MFIKRVSGGTKKRRTTYLQLVEGYRDEEGKVRHRILATLGREDELVRTGQIQRLIKSLGRSLESGKKTLAALTRGARKRAQTKGRTISRRKPHPRGRQKKGTRR